ncbi:MAG TPA: acyl-CoA dehydrogenase family protein [Dehalococcoidia bacterium]|nr:acyl-CoA dehydrogenase family protein [Dehalococcoidia bacterium]
MDVVLSEEQALFQRTIREFATKEIAPHAARLDATGEFPAENIRKMAELGLTGLTIDPEYGGSGGGQLDLAIAAEEICRACAATGSVWLASLGLGVATIHQFGSEAQKKQYLPPLTAGEHVSAFGLTEPNSGSDAAALQLSATRQGDNYVLNGSKMFITNGGVAETTVVFATQDKSQRARGISAFIVEKDTPGFVATKRLEKMGIHASPTAELVFDNVVIPAANRIGEEGLGFKYAMQILVASRIGVASQGLGVARAALEEATAYAKQRMTFGKPIADHQAIQFMLADMATQLEAARLLVYRAASLHDKGLPFTKEASMAKLYASEAAKQIADKAVQIHGGYGYIREFAVERLYRDARIISLYEGTSEIQRLIIARNLLAD